MKINFYVINLDRSGDRLEAITADARTAGIDLIRIAAVDGKGVPPENRTILDEAGFRRLHGKHPMPGEYGCYASHLAMLDTFLASGADAAVVFEDDVQPTPEFLPVLEALTERDDWDLVKFMHHRMPVFRPVRPLIRGRRLGRAMFGPTGSSACYAINRRAAERLRRSLVPMRLPYDVALERGWALGLRVRHVSPDLVGTNPRTRKSLTRSGASYASMKLKPWRRLGALRFRTADFLRRITYSVGSSSR